MQIAEFIKLNSKEANENLKKAFREGKIDVRTMAEWSGKWLTNQGLIKTDAGWHTQAELDEMGLFYDEDAGEWIYETEEREVEYTTQKGKKIMKKMQLPIKAIEYDEKRASIRNVYEDAKKKRLSVKEMENILIGDIESWQEPESED